MELAKTQCYEFECFEDNYSAGRDVGLTQGRVRAILCKNQAKWEMKNFNTPPPPLKFCMQLDIVGGCLRMHRL